MSYTKYDERNLIDGVCDVILKDPSASPITLGTSASVTITGATLAMASSPITAGFRVGDVIVNNDVDPTECRRIESLTSSAIVLEEAFTTPPGFSDVLERVGVNLGYTDTGARVSTKTTYKDREADQSLNAISTKPEKQESMIKTVLQEIFGMSAQLALGLPEAAIESSGTNLKIKVGNLAVSLNTFGVMLVGTREDGKKVTVWASRVVNQGEAGFEFSKGKPSGFALDLKVLNDSNMPAGEEAYVVEIHDDWQYDYLAA
jgi:hypothetical protein